MSNDDLRARQSRIATLRATLAQEEKELRALKEKEHEERNRAFMAGLSAEMINALLPEHGRTSCADDNICNVGRCNRCTLLDALNHGWLSTEYTVEFNIHKG